MQKTVLTSAMTLNYISAKVKIAIPTQACGKQPFLPVIFSL
jgi:hypothetical protein